MANPVKPVNTERMMSKAPGGTDPQAVPPHDSIRALLRAGHNDQAIVQLCAIAVTQPDDLAATAKYGHDQHMLGLMLWPLIRNHCLVDDKYYRPPGVDTVALPDTNGRFGAGHQNIKAVLEEVERLGIPRAL
jgi:hypothetical protein